MSEVSQMSVKLPAPMREYVREQARREFVSEADVIRRSVARDREATQAQREEAA